MMGAGARISDVRKATTSEVGRRVLAIDYGRKRFGLAISDDEGLTARPLATVERANRQTDIRRLREICRGHEVARIVVGYPLRLSGERGAMADEAARFAARLQKELGLTVELQDERLTTWEAQQMAGETKPSARRRRGSLDDLAAAILLREYLERKRGAADVRAAKKD